MKNPFFPPLMVEVMLFFFHQGIIAISQVCVSSLKKISFMLYQVYHSSQMFVLKVAVTLLENNAHVNMSNIILANINFLLEWCT